MRIKMQSLRKILSYWKVNEDEPYFEDKKSPESDNLLFTVSNLLSPFFSLFASINNIINNNILCLMNWNAWCLCKGYQYQFYFTKTIQYSLKQIFSLLWHPRSTIFKGKMHKEKPYFQTVRSQHAHIVYLLNNFLILHFCKLL